MTTPRPKPIHDECRQRSRSTVSDDERIDTILAELRNIGHRLISVESTLSVIVDSMRQQGRRIGTAEVRLAKIRAPDPHEDHGD